MFTYPDGTVQHVINPLSLQVVQPYFRSTDKHHN